ncbi:putative bifunctional diguanylate cyclase/phosphodiesterase [Catellatospora methionotrophica]|uniref:putative bifunctional diguanylate cyclase/phosphodiesterase n=1 Tax=Catellatospora methionotrophica TaxID=121620 RepID=UPI001EF17FD3|nr:bifunctional diguanylate cyclase/phosphodiesterase [Catellatospora methionotrophica]
MTSRVRIVITCLVVTAVLVAGVGAIFGVRDGDLGQFGLLICLITLAHLFGLRMRVGSTTIDVDWGEAALIVGFILVPVSWIPAAAGIGVLLAKPVVSLISGNRTSPMETVRAAASLTLSAALAALVVWAGGVAVVPMSAQAAAVVVLAALIYLLSSAVLLAVHLAVRDGQNMIGVVWQALRGTPVMIVGNVALGLVAVRLWGSSWLWVLPPLLWLLHQLYVHRVHEDEERRTWRAFALASRSLHRLDELAVAQEGLQAARSLFPVRAVELTVLGSQTRYRSGLRTGEEVLVESVSETPPADAGRAAPAVTRVLEVAGGRVGVLTLRLLRQRAWGPNDQHRLAVFGDALAAALHDAATHSALRELRERTMYESHHDPLTRLLNRDALMDRGDAVLRGLDARIPVALLLLDMDHFKEVNDTLGHLAGDELLQTAASRLSADVGHGELLARLGGDEFALLVTDLPGLSAEHDEADRLSAANLVAQRRARMLTAALASPTEVAGVTLSAEVSVGVAVATAGEFDLTELLRRADVALYQAKESGSRVAAYDPHRDRTSTDRLALVAELRAALAADDQLHLVMQPAVELDTGAPSGVEALIRWHHPRRGLLLPKHFVRAVEASDLLGRFTRHVLDQALTLAAQWQREGLDVPVAVNLSPRSLLDPQLPNDVDELLRRHGIPAAKLVLEITETVVLSPLPITDQVLRELRGLGVRFAVDDFGTGFSSLTFLTRIAVDELKVDRTFVGRMAESRQAAAIVQAVVDLGRQLGLRVVAEGVETADQRIALRRLGCDAGQGFYFSHPLPADEITEALHTLSRAARPVRPLRARPHPA